MKKADQDLREAVKSMTGKEPDFYLYAVEMPPLWMHILLFGGLLSALVQKPYMLAGVGSDLNFISTSKMNPRKMTKERVFKLSKTEIKDVAYKPFGMAHYFTLTKQDGSKMKLVANTLFKGLEKQKEGIQGMKAFLGV